MYDTATSTAGERRQHRIPPVPVPVPVLVQFFGSADDDTLRSHTTATASHDVHGYPPAAAMPDTTMLLLGHERDDSDDSNDSDDTRRVCRKASDGGRCRCSCGGGGGDSHSGPAARLGAALLDLATCAGTVCVWGGVWGMADGLALNEAAMGTAAAVVVLLLALLHADEWLERVVYGWSSQADTHTALITVVVWLWTSLLALLYVALSYHAP